MDENEFDRYTIVLLRRPESHPDLTDEQLEDLQARHLAHNDAMVEAGHMLVAGPTGREWDDSLRGICIYRVGLDEARELTEADPMVEVGWLGYDAFTWRTRKDALRGR